ncbi:MAG: ATP-binding protein, partial [Rhizobiales bacterium]|nr:ATP-binding protein [Hyphomicrobiales bacterium]
MVRDWTNAKKAGAFTPTKVADLLRHLGFSNPAVSGKGAKGWFEARVDPIADRDLVPVHPYGSTANGRYRIFVTKEAVDTQLLSAVGETIRDAPVIVFHLGPLTAIQRRGLADGCRQRGRTLVVLDDTLVHFLAEQTGGLLPALFACALPFTTLNPYITTASLVLPEVFYGRRFERQQVEDAFGSCFIYGGRQLGKTALLRDAERAFHNPDAGRVAAWIDLKVEGVGFDRSIDDIWRLIGLRLKQLGVLRTASPDPDRLVSSLLSWLEDESSRRILLLLDESDRFLESDGAEDFVRVGRLKGLMDRTNRRFKVVFVGLHNVQRTARLENQPLAHYGEPLRIGPLLDRDEWREARALITRPLASLGYRFEDPDLVTRILSRTNYFPSLIQLYCSHLIRHVTDSTTTAFDRRTSPPYVLTSRHVDGAYESPELLHAIRDRFLWTLDLDPRYRVIAFAIGYETSGPAALPTVDGYSPDWIRDQAMTWWPNGFQEASSPHLFRALLEEMTGLGILTQTDAGGYTLRSPNIVTLLGSREDIERELLSNEDREPPPAYSAATFRAAYRNSGSGEVDRARRSPLTALQESELRARRHGVSLIFGAPAAGLHEVERFLRSAVGSSLFTAFDADGDRTAFNRQIDNLRTSPRDQAGTNITYVGPSRPWDETWANRALARTGKFSSNISFLRVVFAGDPFTVWRLLEPIDGNGATPLDRLVADGCAVTSLRPWDAAALRFWLEDASIG